MSNKHPLEIEFFTLFQTDPLLLDRFQESVFDGLWYWDLTDTNQRWMNDKFWTLLGYDPQAHPDLQGSWASVIHPDDLQLMETCLKTFIEHSKQTFDQVLRYLNKQGETIYIRCHGFVIHDNAGQPFRLVGVHTNLTDYVDLKNTLTAENRLIKERLNNALEGSSDGVWDWNMDTNEVFYSPRWKAMLGYSEQELTVDELTWKNLLHPDDLDAANAYNQAFLESDQLSYEIRFRMRHKKGHYVPILSRAKKVCVPNPDSKLEFNHLIGTHVDLTNIVEIQEKLNQQIKITRTYLNNTSAIMLALDTNANITMLNQKGQEILGVTEDEVLGKNWFEQPFLPPEILPKIKQDHADFLAERTQLQEPYDHEIITHNQGRKIFTWSNKLLKDDNDQVIGTLSSAIDITERTLLNNQLQQSETLLKQAQKLAKVGHYTLDIKNDCWVCSEEVQAMFGIPDDYLKTTIGWTKIIHPDHQQEMHDYFINGVIAKKTAFDKQYKIINQTTQNTLWVHGKGTLKYDENGQPIEMFGTIQDISEQKRIEDKLTLAGTVYKNANEGIMVTDKHSTIIDVNQAFTDITGFSKKEAIGKTPRMLHSGVHPPAFYKAMWEHINVEGKWSGEIWNRNKTGDIFPELMNISVIKDDKGQVQYYLGLFSDITQQKGNELKLKQMAHFDPLTGLPNRVLFSERLNQAITQANLEDKLISLAFLDLDGFKEINDTLGHHIGDKLLKIIGKRYHQEAREHDTIARIGGDEFIILLNDVKSVEETFLIFERFLAITNQPVHIEGHQLQVTCSIGVTYYPQNLPVDSDQLIRQADNAMYQAKVLGKNNYHVFDNQKDLLARALHQDILAVDNAIKNDEMVLYYQPKTDMVTGRTFGFEALIRWQHPEKGMLQPGDFLPTIEKQPVSINLDKWVIEHAFQQASQWMNQNLIYTISVNLGAQILQSDQLIDYLKSMLKKYPNVPARLIELEVLETSALQDMQHASQLMRQSEAMGIKIAIDDFGTGYSSLEYLKSLPASYLKIDQSFVRDMLVDESDLAILKAVIGLAEAFKMETIAEGVETDEHAKQLIALGCRYGQGYGIAKPMPASAVADWLKA
ncbi:MAG: EAL domain-containing protein [Thiotrichales bacterium]|nr:EAL domain-containing protein [Thiotrichales bacterium]